MLLFFSEIQNPARKRGQNLRRGLALGMKNTKVLKPPVLIWKPTTSPEMLAYRKRKTLARKASPSSTL
jgi:hypothetical protein